MFAVDSYSNESPGEIFLPLFLGMAKPKKGQTVLDAGCGSGKGALALSKNPLNLWVEMVDLVDARVDEAKIDIPFTGGLCLWNTKQVTARGTYDWIYCCDVLEHIPTEFTMLVVANLLAVSRRGIFLSIALEPDNFGALIGRSLHKTVQPFTWWRDRLDELGHVIECRDLLSNGVYLVEAR